MNHFDAQTPDDLSPRQSLAIPAVVASPSLAAAARAAHVSRSTLRRWMRDRRFRTELERVRQEAVELAYTELQALALESVATLAGVLKDPDARVRTTAARAILQHLRQLDADRNIKNRLDILDNTFALIQEQR